MTAEPARRALKAGHRELTGRELEELGVMHGRVLAAVDVHGWLSAPHGAALQALRERCAELAADGVPLSHLGRALGVSKSRARNLVALGRS